jgi:hypothetical protein
MPYMRGHIELLKLYSASERAGRLGWYVIEALEEVEWRWRRGTKKEFGGAKEKQ